MHSATAAKHTVSAAAAAAATTANVVVTGSTFHFIILIILIIPIILRIGISSAVLLLVAEARWPAARQDRRNHFKRGLGHGLGRGFPPWQGVRCGGGGSGL